MDSARLLELMRARSEGKSRGESLAKRKRRRRSRSGEAGVGSSVEIIQRSTRVAKMMRVFLEVRMEGKDN